MRLGCRFETGLLWRTDEIHFSNSFPIAVKRLQSLERKLEKNPELAKNVHQQIQEYLDKGYAHKATESELDSADPQRTWYLPLNVVSWLSNITMFENPVDYCSESPCFRTRF